MIEVPELTPRTEMTYFVHGGRVAIYYRLTLTSRASGQSVEMRVAELFSVREGRITELDVFYKSPSAVAALLS